MPSVKPADDDETLREIASKLPAVHERICRLEIDLRMLKKQRDLCAAARTELEKRHQANNPR